MTRRAAVLTKKCAQEGCAEVGRWSYDSQRDRESSFEARNEYRCPRHTRPQEVLGGGNQQTEIILTSQIGPGDKLYWNGGSGFVYGPGFKAWADDFPEGTKLIVTARIEP